MTKEKKIDQKKKCNKKLLHDASRFIEKEHNMNVHEDDFIIDLTHRCVGHTAWAPEGREAGPKGPKPARRAAP